METITYLVVFVLFIILFFAKYLMNALIWLFIPETIKEKAKLVAFKKKISEFTPEMFYAYQNSFDNPQPLDAISSAQISKFIFPNYKSDGDINDSSTISNVSEYFIRILHSGKKYTMQVTAEVYTKILARKAEGIDDISIVIKKFGWKYQYIALAE